MPGRCNIPSVMPREAELVKTAELIEALSDPSAYPGPVAAVEVRQTHISVVFLVGSLAYKIKRPVSTGFVDYGTPERRRHFCDEEVRLNRRLAPEVYLAVVPVTREGGVIRMEGTGQVVEWAVKMKRLPDAATLGSRLGEMSSEPRRWRNWPAGSPNSMPGPSPGRRSPPAPRSTRWHGTSARISIKRRRRWASR